MYVKHLRGQRGRETSMTGDIFFLVDVRKQYNIIHVKIEMNKRERRMFFVNVS